MKAEYSNIQSAGEVNSVEFATATAHFAGNAQVQVSDRMSKFKLFQYIDYLQMTHDLDESEIDQLLLLIKADTEQAILENEIE